MFIIYDENMNKIDLPQGTLPLDIYISSIQKQRSTGNVEGVNGVVDYGSVYKTRSITVDVGMLPSDTQDYRLLRDEVYSLFQSLGNFYISESYQKGKRYKVTVVDEYIPDRLTRTMAQATFPLEMVDLPFAESIKTTADIDKNGLRYGDGWSYGMGLLYDEGSHKYTHTGTSFKIYNAGSVPIHPFEQDLKITIDNVQGSNDYLQLENTTNGSTFRVTEGVGSNQTIVLDGANITSNGTQYLRKTNKQFIELNPGWNEFEITGVVSARVAFDHPFYFL